MSIFSLEDRQPVIDQSVFIAPTANIIGDVIIGKNSSVWFNCVLRGDADSITIGEETNVQDLTMFHADPGRPLLVGSQVTIGHRCIVHGCILEDKCLIGMGAVIMNGAIIGRGSIVAAGSVILEDTIVTPFSLVAGIPGKVKRTLNEDILDKNMVTAQFYSERAKAYKSSDMFKLVK